MKPQSLLIIFLLLSFSAHADTWTQFDTSSISGVNALATDGRYIWCATSKGVVRVDSKDNSVGKFHTSNGLNDENVGFISANRSGDVWASFYKIDPVSNKKLIGYGIAHFNGTKWTSYRSSASTFSGDVVPYIFCDSTGGAWVTNYTSVPDQMGYMASYQPLSHFDDETWTHYTPEEGQIASENIYAMAEEHNGAMWFGYSGEYGVTRFDGTTWKTYTTDNSGIAGNGVSSIAIDSSNNVWLGTMSGLSRFDGTTWKNYTTEIYENTDMLDARTEKIVIGDNDILWILYLGRKSIGRFDGTTLTYYRKDLLGTGDNQINDIVVDDSGMLWIACDEGLYQFDGVTSEKFTGGTMPAISEIKDIYADTRNNVWLAPESNDNGIVYHYDNKEWEKIDLMSLNLFEKSKYTSATTMCITGDEDGKVYFGDYHGICLYDGNTWSVIKRASTTYSADPYTPDRVMEIDKDGVLWFNNREGNIGAYADGIFHWFSTSSEKNFGSQYSVFCFCVDNENNKWFGTEKHGIRKIDHALGLSDNWALRRKTYDTDAIVNSIAVTPDGTVWYSRYIDSDMGVWRLENGIPAAVLMLGAARKAKLIVDKAGVLWIGTNNNGVYKHENGVFTHYTAADGLLNNKVDQIAIGPNNEKWFVSSELGLTRLVDTPVSVEKEKDVQPETFAARVHPNPFNAMTTISFSLASASQVKLDVYNIAGQRIATLVDRMMSAGNHSIAWDAGKQSSGVYFFRITAGERMATGRMTLVK